MTNKHLNQRNLRLIKDLRGNKVLYTCREIFTNVMSALQINLFMQNKAKFRKSQMNVNNALTKDYAKRTLGEHGKKQSQTNPNKAKLKKAKMNVTSTITKGYENKPPIRPPKKQSQTSKRQKTIQPSLSQRIMKKPPLRTPKKQTQFKPKQTQFQRQNYAGSDYRCYETTAMFTINNVNRNYFNVKSLHPARKSRLIQRVDFLQHRVLTHIRVAFRIVETKLKAYT